MHTRKAQFPTIKDDPTEARARLSEARVLLSEFSIALDDAFKDARL